MRNIHVTGGRKDYADGVLTDRLGNDLSSATLRVGLSTDREVPPTTWYAPSTITYPQEGTAAVSLLIDATIAPAGRYWLWVDAVDNPTSQPVVASNDQIRTI